MYVFLNKLKRIASCNNNNALNNLQHMLASEDLENVKVASDRSDMGDNNLTTAKSTLYIKSTK